MQCTLIPADEGPEYKPKVLFASSKIPAPVHAWRHLHQKQRERNHFTYRDPQGKLWFYYFLLWLFWSLLQTFFDDCSLFIALLLNIHQWAAVIFTAHWLTGCIHLSWRVSVNENSLLGKWLTAVSPQVSSPILGWFKTSLVQKCLWIILLKQSYSFGEALAVSLLG